jgi:hypothetical protein
MIISQLDWIKDYIALKKASRQLEQKSKFALVLIHGPEGSDLLAPALALADAVGYSTPYLVPEHVEGCCDDENKLQHIINCFEKFENLGPQCVIFPAADTSFFKIGSNEEAMTIMLSEMLQKIDLLQKSESPHMIILTSAAPWDIDQRLLRPGRFDNFLFVPADDAHPSEDQKKVKSGFNLTNFFKNLFTRLDKNNEYYQELAKHKHVMPDLKTETWKQAYVLAEKHGDPRQTAALKVIKKRLTKKDLEPVRYIDKLIIDESIETAYEWRLLLSDSSKMLNHLAGVVSNPLMTTERKWLAQYFICRLQVSPMGSQVQRKELEMLFSDVYCNGVDWFIEDANTFNAFLIQWIKSDQFANPPAFIDKIYQYYGREGGWLFNYAGENLSQYLTGANDYRKDPLGFVQELIELYRSEKEEYTHIADLSPTDLTRTVTTLIENAIAAGFYRYNDIYIYVGLCFAISPNYLNHPEVQKILKSADIPPEQKFDSIIALPDQDKLWGECERSYSPSVWKKVG